MSHNIPYEGSNTVLAKNLRKNMTKEERHLWYDFLRSYSVKFTRQKQIGNYIIDFYCAKVKLAIEVDGSQHYEVEQEEYDSERTAFIEKYGIKVIRFTNSEVLKNFDDVKETIHQVVNDRLLETM